MNAFEALLNKVVNISIEFGNGLVESIWPKDDQIEENTVERKYDRRLFLKIKLKNLRDEVNLIRSHEEKLRPWAALANVPEAKNPHIQAGQLLHQMQEHRRKDIREETRATLLAYGYIRGRRYEEIEQNPQREYPITVKNRVGRVAKMVWKYSVMGWNPRDEKDYVKDIQAWMGVDELGRRLRDLQSASSESPIAVQA